MKSHYRVMLIMGLIFISLLANAFLGFFGNYTFIIYLGGLVALSYYFISFEKDRNRYTKDVLLTLLIYSLAYYIITYLLALFTGFSASGYNLTLFNIVRNLFPIIIIILLTETLRYMLACKIKNSIPLIIGLIFIFTFIDLTLIINAFDLTNNADTVKFLALFALPALAKNFLLTYLVIKTGLIPAIVYRFIFELPLYFLPIFPNFGLYLNVVLQILFPIIMIFIIKQSYKSVEKSKVISRQHKWIWPLNIAIVIIILVPLIYLTSGMFKYYALTIGSNSMYPAIKKGDVLVVRKYNDDEMKYIEEGQVLIFNHNDIVVAHRVVTIIEHDNRLIFYTKGDNNNEEDNWPIHTSEIIGTANIRMPFIGWPTVLLSELIHN